MARHSISSNHFSTDQQAVDALGHLEREHPEAYAKVRAELPEEIIWEPGPGSAIDYEAMGVDVEWSSWLIDAIENTGLVFWEDGEPWFYDGEGDPDPDEDGWL